MSKNVFVGVDGCSAGWFAVSLAPENEKNCYWNTGLFPKFSSLIDFLKEEYEQADPFILIDIPIGLKAGGSGERLSDLGARSILKIRNPASFQYHAGKQYMRKAMKKPARSTKSLQENVSRNRHGI